MKAISCLNASRVGTRLMGCYDPRYKRHFLSFTAAWKRDLNRPRGKQQVEALELDAGPVDHLHVAAEAVDALINLTQAASDAAISRCRYEEATGAPAPARAIDTIGLSHLAGLYASDPEAIAGLPH